MKKHMPAEHVIVAGAGPAGLMAAVTAAERGCRVTVYEPNAMAGKKLRITGKGRCNLTNNTSVEDCLAHIPRNARFLYGALSRFSPQDTMTFFEELGLPLKTERGNRVFPQSDRASDVVEVLCGRLQALGGVIRRERVTGLLSQGKTLVGVRTPQGDAACDRLVLATGGLSYPKTGATGDGYRLARQAGHTVTPLTPSLVPLVSPDSFCSDLQGLSLRNIALSLVDEQGKALYHEQGEMLFTHFGVSGPLVLSASAHMCQGQAYRLWIDLKPALDEKTLRDRLTRDLQKHANKVMANALAELTHKRMIPVLLRVGGFDPLTPAHSFGREDRARLVALLKQFPVVIAGPRPIDEAVITRGGVCVNEVSPRTIQSNRMENLFFAGEILDVDAYTGGFNLQIAWSTGFVAGQSV